MENEDDNRLFDLEFYQSGTEFLKKRLALENKRCIAKRIARSEAQAIERGDMKFFAVAKIVELSQNQDGHLRDIYKKETAFGAPRLEEQKNENIIDLSAFSDQDLESLI